VPPCIGEEKEVVPLEEVLFIFQRFLWNNFFGAGTTLQTFFFSFVTSFEKKSFFFNNFFPSSSPYQFSF